MIPEASLFPKSIIFATKTMKFTELYYGDAQRLAMFLSARNGCDIEMTHGPSLGFPLPPKKKELPPEVDALMIGDDEVAFLYKEGENLKYKDRNLRRIIFGETMRSARERKGVSLSELEKRTGIKARNLVNIEDGRYDASIDVVYNICNALGCHIEIADN